VCACVCVCVSVCLCLSVCRGDKHVGMCVYAEDSDLATKGCPDDKEERQTDTTRSFESIEIWTWTWTDLRTRHHAVRLHVNWVDSGWGLHRQGVADCRPNPATEMVNNIHLNCKAVINTRRYWKTTRGTCWHKMGNNRQMQCVKLDARSGPKSCMPLPIV
jgi:hypothetical protein